MSPPIPQAIVPLRPRSGSLHPKESPLLTRQSSLSTTEMVPLDQLDDVDVDVVSVKGTEDTTLRSAIASPQHNRGRDRRPLFPAEPPLSGDEDEDRHGFNRVSSHLLTAFAVFCFALLSIQDDSLALVGNVVFVSLTLPSQNGRHVRVNSIPERRQISSSEADPDEDADPDADGSAEYEEEDAHAHLMRLAPRTARMMSRV